MECARSVWRNGVLSFEALSLLLLIWHQVPVGALKSFGAKSREEAPQRDKIIGERQDGEGKKRPWEEIEFAKSKQASAPSDKSLHDFTIKLNSHFHKARNLV